VISEDKRIFFILDLSLSSVGVLGQNLVCINRGISLSWVGYECESVESCPDRCFVEALGVIYLLACVFRSPKARRGFLRALQSKGRSRTTAGSDLIIRCHASGSRI
jgi:hypothetical protein